MQTEQHEVEFEDFQPFVQPPQWILFSGITPHAFKLYCIMLAHVNLSDGKNIIWPSQASLAALMGLKKADTIPGLLDQLYAIGAVTVRRIREGMVKKNKYIIKRTPPQGWNKPRILSEAYEVAKAKTPVQPVPQHDGVRTPKTGGSVPPNQGVKQEPLPQQEPKKDKDLPSSDLYLSPQAAEEKIPGTDLTLFNAEKPKTQRRATRIPEHFTVTAEMVAWARENVPHVDGRFETANFCDYWAAESGAKATKRDWVAAWRTWMRNAARRAPHFNANGRTPLRESTTDRKVREGLELAQKYKAMEMAAAQ